MAANISEFLSSFNKETARVANFEALVTIPPALLGIYPNGMNHLRFRCEATELPGRSFATADQKTYGPIEVFPVQNYYDKINLTFICSDDMQERKFFDQWMDYISISNGEGAGVRFDFEYKQNYETTIRINQHDITGKLSYSLNLLNVFPVAINPMPLSWDAQNAIQKIPVTFSYRYFTFAN
nr:MAG: hypothetical protein [Caudoviricetes sp.]